MKKFFDKKLLVTTISIAVTLAVIDVLVNKKPFDMKIVFETILFAVIFYALRKLTKKVFKI